MLKIYKRIIDSKRLTQLLILFSFLVTFAVIRIITNLQKIGLVLNPSANSLLHIHHLVPGIILIIFSGYIGLSFWVTHKTRRLMAILFGIGAALTIDEFALWLYLKDVYWEKLGRTSIDAVIYTVIILSIIFVLSEIHDHEWIKRVARRRKQ